MNLQSIAILIIIAAAAVYALVRHIKHGSCSGGCDGCTAKCHKRKND